MRTVLLLLFLALPAAATAAIYKYVDKDGATRYTDQPPSKNAKPMDLPPLQTFDGGSSASEDDEEDAATLEAVPAGQRYARVTLTAPAADQVFNAGNPTVSASADTDPALRPEHKIVFLVDGLPFPAAGGSTSAEISGLTRGAHSIQAVVMNASNAIQAQSEAVSIHISPPSTLQPGFSDQAPPSTGNPAPNPRGITGPTAPAAPSRPPVFTPPS